MRALLVLVAMTAVAYAKPMRPRPLPPFERYCFGPKTGPELQTCMHKNAPTAKEVGATKHAKIIDVDGRRYLFVAFGNDHWQYQWRLDENFELLSESAMKIGSVDARRIETRYAVSMQNQRGTFDHLVQRSAFVCRNDGIACTQLITSCTVMSHGRAIETFIGTIAVGADGSMKVEGDRSQSGDRCGRS